MAHRYDIPDEWGNWKCLRLNCPRSHSLRDRNRLKVWPFLPHSSIPGVILSLKTKGMRGTQKRVLIYNFLTMLLWLLEFLKGKFRYPWKGNSSRAACPQVTWQVHGSAPDGGLATGTFLELLLDWNLRSSGMCIGTSTLQYNSYKYQSLKIIAIVYSREPRREKKIMGLLKSRDHHRC